MEVPAETLRLFPGQDAEALPRRDHRPFLIGRLLEHGDGDDLRWLVAAVGEEALARWLSGRGRRQLSRRSRAFWELLLSTPAGGVAPAASDLLWPL